MTLEELCKKLDVLAELNVIDQYHAAADLFCFIRQNKSDADIELTLVEIMSNCFDERMYVGEAEITKINKSMLAALKKRLSIAS